jgi:hypothetical protein
MSTVFFMIRQPIKRCFAIPQLLGCRLALQFIFFPRRFAEPPQQIFSLPSNWPAILPPCGVFLPSRQKPLLKSLPQKQAQPLGRHLAVVGIQPPVQRRAAAENHIIAIQNPLASGAPDPSHESRCSVPATLLISNELHKQVQHSWSVAETSRRGAYFNFTVRRFQGRQTANFGRELGPIDPGSLSASHLYFARFIGDPRR